MKNRTVPNFGIARFIHEKSIGAVILMVATAAALIWTNSSFYESYYRLWHELKVGFRWGDFELIGSLHHWINDGLMAMLGKQVNIHLKIFLAALAIADNLGAVMVIAVFYTETIDYSELLTAGYFLAVLVVANLSGVRRTVFYAIIGFLGVWIAFVFSGVHALLPMVFKRTAAVVANPPSMKISINIFAEVAIKSKIND